MAREPSIDKLRIRALLARQRYYALGIFVQEFEMMVDANRQTLVNLLAGPTECEMRALIIVSQPSFTAAPLWEATRGVLGETIRYRNMASDQKIKLTGVIKDISRDYEQIVKMRNDLLHATWRFPGVDAGSAAFDLKIWKFRRGWPDGLEYKEYLPSSGKEFIRLAKSCRRIGRMILALGQYRDEGCELEHCLEECDGQWQPIAANWPKSGLCFVQRKWS